MFDKCWLRFSIINAGHALSRPQSRSNSAALSTRTGSHRGSPKCAPLSRCTKCSSRLTLQQMTWDTGSPRREPAAQCGLANCKPSFPVFVGFFLWMKRSMNTVKSLLSFFCNMNDVSLKHIISNYYYIPLLNMIPRFQAIFRIAQVPKAIAALSRSLFFTSSSISIFLVFVLSQNRHLAAWDWLKLPLPPTHRPSRAQRARARRGPGWATT